MTKNDNPELNPAIPDRVSALEGQLHISSYRSPLPPPEHMAAYEATLPVSADRILTLAEKSLDNSIYLSHERVKQSAVGQWLIFGITIASFLVSIPLAYFKAFTACGIVVGMGASFGFLMGITSRFSQGKQK